MLAALVALRVLIPLTVLAAAPGRMPLLPRYDGVHFDGDAVGYLEAVRACYAAFARTMIAPLGVVVALGGSAAAAAGIVLWRRGRRALGLLVPAAAMVAAVTIVLSDTDPPGAAVVGWPLVWAAALSPLPALGLELTPGRAFPVGLALGLAANGVTTVATAYLGLRASGRRLVGLGAAALYATWPLWIGILAGHRAWENGQWDVDTGLHLYTEPLSTMLVVVALAAMLAPAPGEASAVGAGIALGLGTAVKLTNGLVGLVLVPLVAVRHGVRQAAWLAAGGLLALPVVAVWWPKGYVHMFGGSIAPVPAYSLDYVETNWRSSTLFTPLVIGVLVVPAVVGVLVIGDWYARAVLVMPIVVTVAAVSAYFVTYQHPRFLYAALPPLFVLDSAGVAGIVGRASRGLERKRSTSSGPAPR
jgi:hypothetical protein